MKAIDHLLSTLLESKREHTPSVCEMPEVLLIFVTLYGNI